jgi:hypothetical protein
MHAIPVEITRWVDDHQPGMVECRFSDAHGVEHVIVEKAPVVTEAELTSASEYPQQGLVACTPHRIHRADDGRALASISTDEPWHIETVAGVSAFEVPADALTSIDWHLPSVYRNSDDSALPNDEQRRELCGLMAVAFVELRALGWGGNGAQAADLADAFHNLPREIYGWGGWSWKRFRSWLQAYQDKYPDRTGFNYVAPLDAIRAGNATNLFP